MPKALRYIDLFAGAGGLSEGFMRAGYKPVAHVESDKAACYTLKTRAAYHWLNQRKRVSEYNDYLNQKISRDELYKKIPKKVLSSIIEEEIKSETVDSIFKRIDKLKGKHQVDLIVGGPPCQAYSLVGRARDKKGMVGDQRNYLYLQYAEFLKRYMPKLFVFENVIGLLSARDIDGVLYLDKMREAFRGVGYEIKYKVVSAKDFGVLQDRKRVIIVGSSQELDGYFPALQSVEESAKVREIFHGLPKFKAGGGSLNAMPSKKQKFAYLNRAKIQNLEVPITLHSARPHNEQDLEIYRIAAEKWSKKRERLSYANLPTRLKSHKNEKSFLDRFKVVDGNGSSSHTIVAHIQKDGHHYIHPDLEQNRSLTPREAARIQSFPDDYYFESISGKPARTYAFRQIGNAVPVLMAEKLALAIPTHIS